MGIPLIVFVKAFYSTYSHILKSLQASAQLKAITFDTVVEKFVEREKAFRKRKTTTPTSKEVVCLAQKEKTQ